MAAGIELYNDVLNQKGSPALYSDILANRPTFGYTGRLFISTDTNEIYRDTGTSWVLISSGGGGGNNIYNTSDTLTANRTLTNGGFSLTFTGAANPFLLNLDANTNVRRRLAYTTGGVDRWRLDVTDNETGFNSGSNFYLAACDDTGALLRNCMTVERTTGELSWYSEEILATSTANLVGIYNVTRGTYTSATYTAGNPQGSIFNIFTFDPRTNMSFVSAQYVSTYSNVWRFEPTDTRTITMTQSTGIRTMGAGQNQIQYTIPATKTLTVSHVSNYTSLGIYELSNNFGTLAITNAYHIVLNDLNEYSSTGLTLTNRWGIYQGGLNDTNYFNGTTLIGTTTNAGYKFDVSGTARVTQSAYFATASGNVGIGTTSPQTKLALEVPFAANGNVGPLVSGQTGGVTLVQIASIVENLNAGGTGLALYTYTSNGGGTTEKIRISNYGNVGISQTTFGTSATKTLAISTGTAPGSSPADCFQLYSNDITAGNAAAHFRTENGAIVKVYQETTAVGSATVSSPGAGSTIKTDDTFDGYTLQQVVKALRNQGLLA